jgi:hypothetical protein
MTYTAIDPKTMQRLFMGNPFMSQWLSIANTMAGTVRSFWAAELSRMQAAGLQAFNREAMRAWSEALTPPDAAGVRAPAPAAAEIVAVGEVTERAVRRAMPAKLTAAKRSAKPRAKSATPKVRSRKSSSGKRPTKSR